VLVVDEAGMVPTSQLSELLDHVERAAGKLVLVGDHRQLPELEAGGAFRGLVDRRLAVELRQNVRQVNAWERTALEHLREGRAEAALEQYASHGRLVTGRTGDEVRDRLVRDWYDEGDPQRTVMIALRRVDVADLNTRARARIREAGALVGPELRLPGGPFAEGDWVVVKRNELRLGVSNGDRGRVVDVDPERGSLLLECGARRVELGRSFLLGRTERGDPTLVHGYAITGHVAQGMTVDQAFVLASDGINREWAYVAMSRGRHANRLYLAAEPEDARLEFAPREQHRVGRVEQLTARLRGSGAQVLAIDAGRPLEASREVAAAERELRAAAEERRRLEAQRLAWLPGNQQRRADVRRRETAAKTLVRRLRAEQLHGSRAFVDEREVEAYADAMREELRERATQRALERDRGIWRER
jgi:ATP-dependent exoDNAse (exonuclease V) alpha subunit